MSKRFLFFGTGANFSLAVFDRLVELNRLPFAVVVPEYPAGKLSLLKSPPLFIKSNRNPLLDRAESLNIPTLYAPKKFEAHLADQIRDQAFDFILVACWPYRINRDVCTLANMAALNLHPSMLPKFRGADPLEQQMNSEDDEFGVSLHILSEEFDSGDIVKQTRISVESPHNRSGIERNAALAGVDLFIQAMDEFATQA